MSTDVYIDFHHRPYPKAPPYAYQFPLPEEFRERVQRYRDASHQWYHEADVIRIGYLYTFIGIPIPGVSEYLMEYLRDLQKKYPIFNSLTLSEMRGTLQIFDAIIKQENLNDPNIIHGLDSTNFNDYLSESRAIGLAPKLLGKYWYLRVD